MLFYRVVIRAYLFPQCNTLDLQTNVKAYFQVADFLTLEPDEQSFHMQQSARH